MQNEINRRFMLTIRLLSVARQGINIFCEIMNIALGMNNSLYYACLKNIHTVASCVYNTVTRATVDLEKKKIQKIKCQICNCLFLETILEKTRIYFIHYLETSLIGK